MPVYIEYDLYKRRYQETQQKYNEILSEKEELFQRTQPKGIDTQKEAVSGGRRANPFENYLIAKEKSQIDERLNEVKALLEDREKLLRLKYDELRSSKLIDDKVYRMRFVENIRVYKIAKLVNYSEMQIYRIIKRIHRALERC